MADVLKKAQKFKEFRRRLKSGGFRLVSITDVEEAKGKKRKIAHIHLHSIYSIADAMCKPEELAKRAKELGIDTIFLTDHGVISGVIQMKEACDKFGLKFVPACEMYEAPHGQKGDRTKKNEQRENRHITMIPINNEGWGALQYLIQDANTNGFHYNPRTDMPFIKANNLGANIIATSGCLGSEVSALLMSGKYDEAKAEVLYRAEIFHTYFLEIQDNGSREQEIVNQQLIQMAGETGLPLIYAKDVHYVFNQDRSSHHTLVAISRKQTVNECIPYPGTNTYHFAGADEVYEWAYQNQIPLEALENTVKVAEMCDIKIELGKQLMPDYPFCEDGHTPETYLKKLLYDNLISYIERCEKNGKKKNIKEYIERIEYEYSVVVSKNVASYFLILWDILAFCQNRKKWMSYPVNAKWLGYEEVTDEWEVIRPNEKYQFYPLFYIGPGRGSAAGSLMAFLLDITRLDPLEYDLLFERFLNPDRKGLPDIDIDFPGDNHEAMIDFVAQRYGRDKTAQVKTFTYFKVKSAIDKICAALEERDPKDKRKVIAYGRKIAEEVKSSINMIVNDANKMPDQKDVTYKDMMEISLYPENYERYGNALPKAIEASKQFRDYMTKYPELHKNLKAIENAIDTSGIHAGAVIISKRSLHLDCPTIPPSDKSKAVLPITMYDYPDAEKIGLLKMDLLRTATLRIISRCLILIKERHGIELDIYDIGRDDPDVFRYISEGNTHGLFQIAGGGITGYTRQVAPKKQSELIDILALYRPGPLDAVLDNGSTIAQQYIVNGNKKELKKYLDNLDPAMREVLRNSRGQMVYQEQIMQLVRNVSGYSRGQADGFRKVISKKKIDDIKKQYDIFVYGHKKTLAHWKKAFDSWDEAKKFKNDKGDDTILVYDNHAKRKIHYTKMQIEERVNEAEKDMKLNEIKGAIMFAGFKEQFADNLFRQIEAFGAYGFNKSHSACYADETYQTAYLKYYYPTEFMAALLTVRGGNKESVLDNLKETKRMGLRVLAPHINHSDIGFFPDDDGIRFGLVSIDGVGEKAVLHILDERKANGEFIDFNDFYKRCITNFVKSEEKKTNPVNRSVIRQLIKAGCFDEFESNRHKLLNYYNFDIRGDKVWTGQEEILEKESAKSNHSIKYDEKAYTEKRMLEMERELIGLYVSGSPYEGLPFTSLSDMQLSTRRDKVDYDIGGRISKVRIIKTKKKEDMAFVEIETQLEPVEFTVFPNVFEEVSQHLFKDNIIVVRGYKEKSYYNGQDKESFICQKILVNQAKKLKKELGVKPEKPAPKEELLLPIEEQSRPAPKKDLAAELFNDKPKKKKRRLETVADYL